MTKIDPEFKERWKQSSHAFRGKINAEKVKKDFNEDAYLKEGIVRWKSNNQIPPRECLSSFAYCGLMSWADAQKCNDQREKETHDLLLGLYNNLPDEWDADPEELWEAQANCDGNRYLINPIGARLDLKTGKWKKL